MDQEEINRAIVRAARKYGHVVRLKGGDPFVFGRGMEEIEYAQAQGIRSVEVIPGISSAIAGPAAAGIPVTCRGLSQSFWVITATSKKGGLTADLAQAAQSNATVVLLMGIRKLTEIATLFGQYRTPETPIAVIQNATLGEQKTWSGCLANLSSAHANIDLQHPGIIVIGEVVQKAHWLHEAQPELSRSTETQAT